MENSSYFVRYRYFRVFNRCLPVSSGYFQVISSNLSSNFWYYRAFTGVFRVFLSVFPVNFRCFPLITGIFPVNSGYYFYLQRTDSLIGFATVLRYNNTLKKLDTSRPILTTNQEEATVHMADMLKVNRQLAQLSAS